MSLLAQPATDAHFDRVVRDDEVMRDASGRVVFQFIKRAVRAPDEARVAWIGVQDIEPPSFSRRAAAGVLDVERFRAVPRFKDIVSIIANTSTTGRVETARGELLAEVMSNPVQSYLAGYGVDRFTKTARANRLTHRHPRRWAASLPLFRGVDAVLRAAMPAVHERMCARTAHHPRWSIDGTALSTVTINVDYESRFHRDSGDFMDGYSAMTVIEDGAYIGGLFVLPEHRVAIDVREGDVLLCQSHVDVHGNTPIEGRGHRYSFVCYLKHALIKAVNAHEAAV